MDLNALHNIDLGIDPLTSCKLKGSLQDFYFAPNYEDKSQSIIRLRVNVAYFDENDNPIDSERLQPYTKEHYAEESFKVNSQGLVDENGTIGETTFFIEYVEDNNIDLFGSFLSKIIEAKNRGVFYI